MLLSSSLEPLLQFLSRSIAIVIAKLNSFMTLYAFLGGVEMGLIFSLVALGVFISFRLLRFPDLTVDGSFTLGAAVTAYLIIGHGANPFLATAAGAGAGFIAGLATAFLSVKLRIMDLLASILVMTALYSINLRIMGSNQSIMGVPTFFNSIPFWADVDDGTQKLLKNTLIMIFIVTFIKFALDWFFSTEIGLAIRSTGSNARMARAQGVPTGLMMMLGLAISNALVGLAGSLYTQSQSTADASMGIGTIVIGLASVILGERLIGAHRIFLATLAVIIGAILYRLFIAMALEADSIGLQAQDLQLITASLVTFVLILPLIGAWFNKTSSRFRSRRMANTAPINHKPEGEQ